MVTHEREADIHLVSAAHIGDLARGIAGGLVLDRIRRVPAPIEPLSILLENEVDIHERRFSFR
jgi:hypothetical protein